MKRIYLSLGSNLGDRHGNLAEAAKQLSDRTGRIVGRSGIYESVAWGYQSRYTFYNCCISLESEFGPIPLLDRILETEKAMGRKRMGRGYRDRIIDIDILFYGAEILKQDRLTIPHPGISRRRFVLAPLNEIAPDLVHPQEGRTISELLQLCPDRGGVKKLKGLRID